MEKRQSRDDPIQLQVEGCATNAETVSARDQNSQDTKSSSPELGPKPDATSTSTVSQSSSSILNDPGRKEWKDCFSPNCEDMVKRNVDPSKKRLICRYPDCSKEFRRTYKLQDHIRSHTGEKPYVCSWTSCEKRFTSYRTLARHKRKHTAMEIRQCRDDPIHLQVERCATNAETVSAREQHSQDTKSSSPKLLPKLAPKPDATLTSTLSQSSSSKLSDPGRKEWKACFSPNCEDMVKRNVDPSKKRYICRFPDCSKEFRRIDRLRSHFRTHTGEKPYVCSWTSCEKRFNRSPALKRHIRTHTGERKYQCTECGKRLTRRAYLLRHIKCCHTENA